MNTHFPDTTSANRMNTHPNSQASSASLKADSTLPGAASENAPIDGIKKPLGARRVPRLKLFGLLSLAALGLVLFVSRKKPAQAPVESHDPQVNNGKIIFPPNSAQLAVLSVEPVKASSIRQLQLNGRLAWNDEVTVRVFSPLAGRVLRIVANPGSRIEKNDILAVISSPDYGQAQADASKAATDLALAERNAARLRELSEHGAAAAKDVAAAEADLARAQAEATRTKSRLAMFGSLSDSIDSAFALKAPLAGVVVEKNINPGQEVRPDQMLANIEKLAAPLFVITDPTKLWLHLDVTEAEAAMIQVGQKLHVRVPTHPGESFEALLEFESDALDPVTRTIKARAVVDNSSRKLKAEQLVTVDVALEARAAKSFELPSNAVFLKGDRHYAFVETSPGQFVRRELTLGLGHHGNLQVTAGLHDGERIVTDGVMLLEQVWQTGSEEAVIAAESQPQKSPASTL